MSRPILYAHRGAAAEEPENTLPSFRRALELGADALETDVHLSRDGHVVVSHDADGRRMAGVARRIAACRLDEIRTWDAGYGFVAPDGGRPFAGKGYVLPTFEEMLEELPGVRINVDLKGTSQALIDGFLNVVRRHEAEDRVCAASFFATTLRRIRRAGYQGDTAFARFEFAEILFLPKAYFALRKPPGDIAQIPVRAGPLNLGRRSLVKKCHDLGLRVDFWTVNDPAEAERLLGLGADGIMTDDPAAIVPVFQRLGLKTGAP